VRVSVPLCLALLLAPPVAEGWTIATPVTSGCHERITAQALARVGYAESPPELDESTRSLLDALTFSVPAEDRNLLATSLLMGSRSIDLGGRCPLDLVGLVSVHNDPDRQSEHCLRSREHDGEQGDQEALRACSASIMAELDEAFSAAAAASSPDEGLDPLRTRDVSTCLLIVGEREVPVSALYYGVGRALHVLQDSFTHCLRVGPRLEQVAEVESWIEMAAGSHDPLLDGPAHAGLLDECACGLPLIGRLEESAVQASADLLAAATLVDDAPRRAQAIETVLDEWLSYRPGCTRKNGYCQSPSFELVERYGDDCPDGEGCSAAVRRSREGPLALSGLIALALLGWWRRR